MKMLYVIVDVTDLTDEQTTALTNEMTAQTEGNWQHPDVTIVGVYPVLVDVPLPTLPRATGALVTQEVVDAMPEGPAKVRAQARRTPVAIEARCVTCGETFNPADETDLVHLSKFDGRDCGGFGEIQGEWY